MADRVRVLIADDSAFVRRAVERMLLPVPEVEVVGIAETGEEAIELATELRPDVVILDVNMPGIDGVAALRTILAEAPTGVIMLSTPARQDAGTTLSALELGAVDFLDKTSAGSVMDLYSLAPLLREKVLAVAGAAVQPSDVSDRGAAAGPPQRPDAAPAKPRAARRSATSCAFDLVVVGASTGGPRALAELLTHLPGDFGAGIVVAQHMPSGFTETLADRLNRRCLLDVREGSDGDRIEAGLVLVIPGGTHATVQQEGRRLVLRTTDGTADLIHRPSIDLLFRSAAAAAADRAIGVVLTGMGSDGARGLESIRQAGGGTVAESESSAVIFGMPRAAAAFAERVLPLQQIGDRLVDLCAPASRPEE